VREQRRRGRLCLALCGLAAAVVAGCAGEGARRPTTPPTTGRAGGPVEVPSPIDLLLPKSIRIHPFTGTRVFDQAGGVTGIDARIEAIDGYGDANKAFGQFRFELFRFKPNSRDPKGRRLAVWRVAADSPKNNRAHWDSITRTYQFKLAWDESIPVGQKFVLLAVFDSRFTDRLMDERVFVSGQ